MGEAGRQRARTVYDWAAIIPQDEALWAQLADIAKVMLPRQEEIQTVLQAAAEPKEAIELIASIPPARQALVLRSLAWLVKLGVLKVL